MEPTMIAVALAAIFGVLGGLANEAYAYLKMNEPFTAKECAAKAVIGAFVGPIIPLLLMPDFIWYLVVPVAGLAGYFGIDAVEIIIGAVKPAKKE